MLPADRGEEQPEHSPTIGISSISSARHRDALRRGHRGVQISRGLSRQLELKQPKDFQDVAMRSKRHRSAQTHARVQSEETHHRHRSARSSVPQVRAKGGGRGARRPHRVSATASKDVLGRDQAHRPSRDSRLCDAMEQRESAATKTSSSSSSPRNTLRCVQLFFSQT